MDGWPGRGMWRNGASRRRSARARFLAGAALALLVCNGPASAQTLSREPAPGELRLGQRVLVDDGTCPTGQVKQVIGAKLTAAGVQSVSSCISRKIRR